MSTTPENIDDNTAKDILKKYGMSESEIDEFLVGVKAGIKAYLAGKVRSWDEVKKELGIE